jgi:hypothetical protein
METINFSTLDISNTRSNFVHSSDKNDIKPTHIYRHDNTKFELREIKDQSASINCELKIEDIMDLDSDIQDVQ